MSRAARAFLLGVSIAAAAIAAAAMFAPVLAANCLRWGICANP